MIISYYMIMMMYHAMLSYNINGSSQAERIFSRSNAFSRLSSTVMQAT